MVNHGNQIAGTRILLLCLYVVVITIYLIHMPFIRDLKIYSRYFKGIRILSSQTHTLQGGMHGPFRYMYLLLFIFVLYFAPSIDHVFIVVFNFYLPCSVVKVDIKYTGCIKNAALHILSIYSANHEWISSWLTRHKS